MRRLALAILAAAIPVISMAGDGLEFKPSPTKFGSGSASSPAVTFGGEATGFYHTAGTLYLSLSGTGRFRFGATGLDIYIDSSAIRLGTGSDLVIGRDAAAKLQLGADATTATAQTIKGPDSTGAGIAGGALILGSSSGGAGGERGPVRVEDGGTKPTCAAGIRGAIWYDAGGAGVADTFEVCRKDAGDAYAWVTLF